MSAVIKQAVQKQSQKHYLHLKNYGAFHCSFILKVHPNLNSQWFLFSCHIHEILIRHLRA